MARVAPFCHRCAWDGRGAVGRARNKVTVDVSINQVACTIPLDLCQVCYLLFDDNPKYKLETTTLAAIQVARSGIGL